MPLTVALDGGQVAVGRIAIKLDGRDVEISAELRNETDAQRTVAFYASTPLFGQLGEGEEHLDKRFTDLAIAVNGTPRKTRAIHHAYFMGQEISAALTRAGLGILPDLQADPKKLAKLAAIDGVRPLDWQASATYSWVDRIAPGKTALHRIRYRALPQFGLEDAASRRFEERIRQHCGDPASVRARLASASGDAQQAIVERYELPVPFMALHDVEVSVVQPQKNWLGARPVAILACGLPPSVSANQLAGTISPADQALAIAVISIVLPADSRP